MERHLKDSGYVLCPVCGEYAFPDSPSHDICSVCGWEDDGYEDMPLQTGGANNLSFADAKKSFAAKRAANPKNRRDDEAKKE